MIELLALKLKEVSKKASNIDEKIDNLAISQEKELEDKANAILKVAGSTQSCQDATLYITLSPCKDCSKLIHQSGIKRVVYQMGYRDDSGLQFLVKAGVQVVHIPELED